MFAALKDDEHTQDDKPVENWSSTYVLPRVTWDVLLQFLAEVVLQCRCPVKGFPRPTFRPVVEHPVVSFIVVIIQLILCTCLATDNFHSREELLVQAPFPMTVVVEGVRDRASRPWVFPQKVRGVYVNVS